MKRLLNTLYIMSEDVYLTLDGENVVAKCGEKDYGTLSSAHIAKHN